MAQNGFQYSENPVTDHPILSHHMTCVYTLIAQRSMCQRLVAFAEKRLIECNTKLVQNRVRCFYATADVRADLFQEGVLALRRAIYGFDSSRGVHFSTYAVRGIHNAMKRCLQHRSVVHVPDNHSYRLYQVQRYLEDSYGRKPTVREMHAYIAEYDDSALIQAFRAMFPLDIDAPVRATDESAATFGDMMPDRSAASAPNSASHNEMAMDLDAVMAEVLTDRERTILKYRFGISIPQDVQLKQKGPGLTLEQVAEIYGVQKERIRQIQNVALRKLAEDSRIEDLYNLVEG